MDLYCAYMLIFVIKYPYNLLFFGLTLQNKIKSAIVIVTTGTAIFTGHSMWSGNDRFYQQFVMPTVQMLDGETAHKVAVKAAKYKLVPKCTHQNPSILVSSYTCTCTYSENYFKMT